MSWIAAGAAVLGAGMNYMGSREQAEAQRAMANRQWEPYGPIADQFNSLAIDIGNMDPMQAYGGNYYADMDPMLQDSLRRQYEFGAPGGMGDQYARMMSAGGGALFDQGMSGYNQQLNRLEAGIRPEFQFDQGLYDQSMNNSMIGLRSAVDAQGRLSSMALQSNLGGLIGQAGQTAPMGSTALDTLVKGSAGYQAQNQLNNQQFAANLYNNANQQSMGYGMDAGRLNMQSAQNAQRQLMGGYNNLMGIGRDMQGAGYAADINNLALQGRSGSAMQDYNQFVTDMNRQQFMDEQFIPRDDRITRATFLQGIGNNQTPAPDMFNPYQAAAGALQSGLGYYDAFSGMDFSNLFGGGGGGTNYTTPGGGFYPG